jgi:nitrogen fixation NifU-like protein
VNKLYQEALKTHSSSPVGLEVFVNTTHYHDGYNSSCGDEINFSLEIEPTIGTIKAISFSHDSCAICTASASILCEQVKGYTKQDFEVLFETLNSTLQGSPQENCSNTLIKILTPVSKFPSRINCALLPWQTVLAAFDSPFVDRSLKATS